MQTVSQIVTANTNAQRAASQFTERQRNIRDALRELPGQFDLVVTYRRRADAALQALTAAADALFRQVDADDAPTRSARVDVDAATNAVRTALDKLAWASSRLANYRAGLREDSPLELRNLEADAARRHPDVWGHLRPSEAEVQATADAMAQAPTARGARGTRA